MSRIGELEGEIWITKDIPGNLYVKGRWFIEHQSSLRVIGLNPRGDEFRAAFIRSCEKPQ